MRHILTASILAVAASVLPTTESLAARPDSAYGWLEPVPAQRIANSFTPPASFVRSTEAAGSYGDWLRHLPLAAPGTPVRNHDGREKTNQASAAVVIAIDVGRRDLQQCADAVMRLRAEYLRAAGRAEGRDDYSAAATFVRPGPRCRRIFSTAAWPNSVAVKMSSSSSSPSSGGVRDRSV